MIGRKYCKEKLDDNHSCDSNSVEVKMLHFSLYQEQAVKSWEFPGDEFVTYKFVYLISFCKVFFIKYWCFLSFHK